MYDLLPFRSVTLTSFVRDSLSHVFPPPPIVDRTSGNRRPVVTTAKKNGFQGFASLPPQQCIQPTGFTFLLLRNFQGETKQHPGDQTPHPPGGGGGPGTWTTSSASSRSSSILPPAAGVLSASRIADRGAAAPHARPSAPYVLPSRGSLVAYVWAPPLSSSNCTLLVVLPHTGKAKHSPRRPFVIFICLARMVCSPIPTPFARSPGRASPFPRPGLHAEICEQNGGGVVIQRDAVEE